MQTAPRVGAQRIQLGVASAVARGALRDQDGSLLTSPTGSLTADVVTLAGVVSGAANRPVTNTDGVLTVDLTEAECSNLDLYEIRWKQDGTQRASSWVRIVGGFLYSLEDLSSMTGLEDFPPALIARARDWSTDLIEHQTGAAWCPRLDADAFWGRDSLLYVTRFRPIRTVRSIRVDDQEASLANLEIDYMSGALRGVWLYDECVVTYEHGYDQPTSELREASLVAAHDFLLRGASGLSQRARAGVTELGLVQTFSFPSVDRPTGIDFVDAAIAREDRRLPFMA